VPLAAAEGDGLQDFAAPDLSGQSIMLVAPQSIEPSLISRRLQRWGAQTCLVSDLAVAQALLPERTWQAVLIDHGFGATDIEAFGEAARGHATQRIVMFTPATRQELQPTAASAFTGYLVKPLRAASLAARLTAAPEIAAPSLAGELHAEPAESIDLQTTVYVSRDDLATVARALHDAPDLDFALLADITAVDFWPREPRYELVYMFVSIAHRRRLRLKLRLDANDAHAATLSAIWPAANWLEREVWDLFGIEFDGHPDLRRLLMPEDWDGHPLRKDYPVQIRMTPRSSEPLQVTPEEFRASVERDRLVRRE